MKNVLLLSLLLSCSNEESTIRTFIPGTYARTVKNEFSEGGDTLIIQHLGRDNYNIEHVMTWQRITNGKLGIAERKREQWTALYNERSGVLLEQRRGRVLSLQPDGVTLLVGSSPYKKITSF